MPLKAPALAHDGRCTPPLCSACSTADLERNPSGRICCLFDLAGEHNTSATAMAHQAVCRAARQHHASCISTSLYRLSCCPAHVMCAPPLPGLRPRNLDVKALLAIFELLQASGG